MKGLRRESCIFFDPHMWAWKFTYIVVKWMSIFLRLMLSRKHWRNTRRYQD